MSIELLFPEEQEVQFKNQYQRHAQWSFLCGHRQLCLVVVKDLLLVVSSILVLVETVDAQ